MDTNKNNIITSVIITVIGGLILNKNTWYMLSELCTLIASFLTS
ncbi:MAG: hypothetical protein E6239_02120 [Clostridium perfringens]|nr:hypothetical protein [Clostridium perfringens]